MVHSKKMVVEVVLFRLEHNTSEADFLRAADLTNKFLSCCKGFIRRRLGESDDGWIDYVEWQSMADALAAAKQFNESPDTKHFNELIEPGSTVVRHLTVRSEVNSD